MMIEFEIWQLITLGGSLLAFVIAGAKYIVTQGQQNLERQFQEMSRRLDNIDANGRDEANKWQRVEREMLSLKAELPLHYVRREDYVQAIATIMAKLDAMSLRFENLILKGGGRAE